MAVAAGTLGHRRDLLVRDGVDEDEAVHVLVVVVPHGDEGVLPRRVEDLEGRGLPVHHVVVLHVGVLDGGVVVVLTAATSNILANTEHFDFLLVLGTINR